MKIERIREKLSDLIRERKISQRALSVRAGIAHNGVNSILTKNASVTNVTLEKILSALGVSLADFWETDDGPAKQPAMIAPAGTQLAPLPPHASVLVPDCGTISAGPFRLSDPDTTTHFCAGTREDEGSYVLTVRGNSMEPEYRDGELIFLKRESIHLISLPKDIKVGVPYDRIKHLHGKDCVLLMKDEGCTFKRLSIKKTTGPEYIVT